MKTQYPMNIVIYCGGMAFHGDTLKEKSLGGSETAALQMAIALKRIGHKIVVFSNCGEKAGDYNGVVYKDIHSFPAYAKNYPIDVLIGQRDPRIFGSKHNSKLNILWSHDLATIRSAGVHRAASWNIDYNFIMSEFQKKQSMDVIGFPEEFYWITKNGIDLSIVDSVPVQKRNPKKLMYAARPERGLDIVLTKVLPRLIEKDKEIEINIAGYDHAVPEMENFYRQLNAIASQYPENVKLLGCLSKQELYKHYKSAGMYIYPTNFEEIFCISAVEAMACGLPFITRNHGALSETLSKDASIIIDGYKDSNSPEFLDKFCETVLNLIQNPALLKQMGYAGVKYSKKYTWDKIAKDWDTKFIEHFKKVTENKITLAKHFVFNSDILAVKKLLPEIPEGEQKNKLIASIEPWELNFSDNPIEQINSMSDIGVDTFLKEIGGFDKLVECTVNKTEPYWPMLGPWIEERKNIKTFLDYGCFAGRYANAIAASNPEYKVYGVDINARTLEVARKVNEKINPNPENCVYIEGTYQTLELPEKVDCILLFDILEHLPNVTEAIEELEKFVKPDGWILTATPAGPIEAESFGKFKSRMHIHHFETEDLNNVFEKKKNFQKVYMVANNAVSHVDSYSPIGTIMCSYQVDNSPTGEINWDRKLLIQAPRQTVSACMITKNAQGMLHRCLKSLDWVDEIIIADTGSTDNTIEIAKSYGAKIITGSDPNKTGFETPRNESIAQATGDWILWIDADEEFTGSKNLFKYLKHNSYIGYSIRQHHFSVSPPNAFKPDLPVRLFRNHQDIRFYGLIHEHPEKGINKGVGNSIVLHDVDIAHAGYYTEEGRRKRFMRNLPLLVEDRKKYPERILGKFFELRDLMHLAHYEIEQNRGNITPTVIKYCNTAIDLYRNEFLGKSFIVDKEALGYYSQANRILNQGIEINWNIQLNKHGDSSGNDSKAIFANQEDMQRYFEHMLETGSNKYFNQYF